MSALLDALALRPGALRLMALRLGALVVCFAPARLVGAAAWDARVGADPRLVSAEAPLPMTAVADGLTHLSPAFLGLLGVGVALWLLLDQLLTAAAARTFAHAGRGEARVWRAIFDDGWRCLLPYLRVVVVALVLAGLGAAGLKLGFTALGQRLQGAGATGEARFIDLNLARATVALLLLSLVGTLAFWTKLLIAVDGRRRVRRALLEAARILLRRPLAAGAPYFLARVALGAAGPFVLAAGLPTPGPLAALAWLLFSALQVGLWCVLIQGAVSTYAAPRFDALRARGDAPLGLLRRLRLGRA